MVIIALLVQLENTVCPRRDNGNEMTEFVDLIFLNLIENLNLLF